MGNQDVVPPVGDDEVKTPLAPGIRSAKADEIVQQVGVNAINNLSVFHPAGASAFAGAPPHPDEPPESQANTYARIGKARRASQLHMQRLLSNGSSMGSQNLDGGDALHMRRAPSLSNSMGGSMGGSLASSMAHDMMEHLQQPRAKSKRASMLMANLNLEAGKTGFEAAAFENRPWWKPRFRAILPTERWYQLFTYFTMFWALLNSIADPFKVAFGSVGGFEPYTDAWSFLEYIGILLFGIDIVLKFFAAYEDPEQKVWVTDLDQIARHFASKMLWFDLIFWFPFVGVINQAGGYEGKTALFIGLLAFLKLGRLYRIFDLFDMLDRSMVISQISLMLLRNFIYILLTCHWYACIFYFTARAADFSEETWVGRNFFRFADQSTMVAYSYALYFSVTGFAGLGDGDFYTANWWENIIMSLYLLFNVVLGAYILGTVTMLMVKGDEQSKNFRDKIQALKDYSKLNELPEELNHDMRQHLELNYQSEQYSDANVLTLYPPAIKKRVMRHLYLEPLKMCYLLRGCKARFFDALLAGCSLEVFMPGVTLLSEGDVVGELSIVIEGEVEVVLHGGKRGKAARRSAGAGARQRRASALSTRSSTMSALPDAEIPPVDAKGVGGDDGDGAHGADAENPPHAKKQRPPGELRFTSDVFGEVAFLTETPSMESVYSTSVVSILAVPRDAFEPLAASFKSQIHAVQVNLSRRIEREMQQTLRVALDTCDPSTPLMMQHYSRLSGNPNVSAADVPNELLDELLAAADEYTSRKLAYLVEMQDTLTQHRSKNERQRLFDLITAAANGDVNTMRTSIEAGCNPSLADYSGRTPLMAASQSGRDEAVEFLLSRNAHHGARDSLGRNALLYAVRANHANVINLLVGAGASLAMFRDVITNDMMEAVTDGDLSLLARFLQAGADPDLSDCDSRTILHVAATEGSVHAVKILLEAGADLLAQDCSGRIPLDDAERARAMPVVEILKPLTDEARSASSVDSPSAAKRRFMPARKMSALGNGAP